MNRKTGRYDQIVLALQGHKDKIMITLPETKFLITEFSQGWLTIWFNSPENRNALSARLTDELMQILQLIENDRTVRGITLRGKGGVFCAGGDLKEFHGLAGGASRDDIIAMNERGGELFAKINAMPQAVLVLVEGAAIAGGLGMICCADMVAITRDAKFSLTETQLGIVPAQIAHYIVKRLGLNQARRLMLSGARFNGDDAFKMGLADFVAKDSAELEAIEAHFKKDVLRCAPNANAITKDILLNAGELTPSEMRTFAANRFADAMLSDEAKEGISSFIGKRKPAWAQSVRNPEDVNRTNDKSGDEV